jgi:tetratricopeptide (TPR) repeat protein
LTSQKNLLEQADARLEAGDKVAAAEIFTQAAKSFESERMYREAAQTYEKAGTIYRELHRGDESLSAFDQATLMLVRQVSSPEVHREIVRVNIKAAKVAEDAMEYKKAADFYFRAADFAEMEPEKQGFTIAAADALENLADTYEEAKAFDKAITLLRKVGGLYHASGDEELGSRINDRAIKMSLRWSEEAKKKRDFLSAGNALAEVAQVMHSEGDSPEAIRMMMEAGNLYERSNLFEKAGNIYDAAQEAYKLQRLTSARKQAIMKAAEAYMKMDGKPEIVAPLLVKAGNMLSEIGSDMKARWALKRANELFGQLAERAAAEKDSQSEMSYLRYQAMCLKKWGKAEQAEEIYKTVITYFLGQAKADEESENKEFQAQSLEEAADVLEEAGRSTEAKGHLERALEIYVQLADECSTQGEADEGSKYYSKAADCAFMLGDEERTASFHLIASDKAVAAAKFYEELGVPELAAVWVRTAGTEALKTNEIEMIEKAIELLNKSAASFKGINEPRDAFEDFLVVFETLYDRFPRRTDDISRVIKKMDDLAMTTRDDALTSIMSILHAVESGSHIGALLILQENEEDLLSKRDRLHELVETAKFRSRS